MNANNQTQPRSMSDFLNDVIIGIRGSDLFLILSIPLILSIIFVLPKPIQNSFILDYGSPSIFNLWSSAYVHRGIDHFSNNVVTYCILIVPIYLLLALADKKKLFRYTFLSFLLVVPVVIALANIAVIGQGTGAGFSGIGSAFFGFLPLSFFIFVENRISEKVEVHHSVPLFLIAAGLITLIYVGILASAGIFLISGMLAIYNLHQIGFNEVKMTLAELISMNGYFELVLLAFLLFLISPMLLFPQEIVQDGQRVNILSHYVGLVLGFFGPTIFLMIWNSRYLQNPK